MDRGSPTSPTARVLAPPASCPVARARTVRTALLVLSALLLSASAPRADAQSLAQYTGKVVEIRIEGNRSIPSEEIRAKIHTREGLDLDRPTLAADVTRLLNTGWFADNIQPYVKKDPKRDGLIITFRVEELPILRAVEFRGRTKVRLKEIEETTGLTVGAHADSMKNRASVGQIKRLYEDKGYEWADVKLVEGGSPGDTRAIFQILEGPKCRLLAVSFTGNHFVSAAVLRTKLASHVAILGIGGVYHKEDMFEDVKKLTEYYQSQGFFGVKIRPVVRADPNMGDKRVEFVVWEGAQFKVRNVTFQGNHQVSTEALRAGLVMHSGQPYSDSMREADLKHLRHLYGSIGCIDAQVRPNVTYADPVKSPGIVDIVYEINEGSQYRLGRLVIHGNMRTMDDVLRREANMSGLVPGEPIDIERLEKFKQRIGNLRYFAATPDQGKPIEVRIINRRGADQPFGEVDIDVMEELTRARMQSPDDLETTPFGSSAPLQTPAQTAIPAPSNAPRPRSAPSSRPRPRFVERLFPRLSSRFRRDPQPQAEVARLQNAPSLAPPPSVSAPPLTAPPVSAAPFAGPDNGQPGVAPTMPDPLAPGPGPMGAAPIDASGLFAPPVDAPVVDPNAGAGVVAPPNIVMPPAIPPQGGPGTRTQPIGADVPPGLMPSMPGSNMTDVGPDRQEPFNNRSYADIITQVDEVATGRLMFGVGASSYQGLSGNFILHETNFDIFNLPRSPSDLFNGRAFRGRGQDFQINLQPGTAINRAIVSFRDPYLFNLPVALGVEGYTFKRFYPDWTESRTGARVSLGRQFGTQTYADVAFRAEDVNLYGFRMPAPADFLAASGHTQLYSIRPSLRFDNRNDPFAASRGQYLEFAFEQGWGTFTFPKATIEGRQYFTLGSRPDGSGKRILTMRGFYGVSGRDTPVYERFFAGDWRSMRGFYYRGVGPHVFGANIGGIQTLLGSVEYQFPWTANDKLQQVIFTDFGTVTNDYQFNNFRVAVGTGVRVYLPQQLFGPLPLAFDLAYPIVKQPGDRTRYFTFFIGAFW